MLNVSVGMTCTQIPTIKYVKYECGYDVYYIKTKSINVQLIVRLICPYILRNTATKTGKSVTYLFEHQLQY